ncbi:MAG: hypothetical protein IT178_11565 [Acidobacteria bacterium]|nr:hypothetical protein [Acidobacteriota bacterium]
MQFAVALPWWGYTLIVAFALLMAWAAYRRVAPLTDAQRLALTALRAFTLLAIVVALLRPVLVRESNVATPRVLPVLVDVSRSMSVADEDNGATRLAAARNVASSLATTLAPGVRVELLSFGDALQKPADGAAWAADAARSDLTTAVEDAAQRYRAESLAGIVVVSDGGDTSGRPLDAGRLDGAPVFAVGVGSVAPARDREVVNLTAGEPILPEAAIDLSVSVTSRGFGVQPIDLRLSANGRPVEVRRVTPPADGAPMHEVFTVTPPAEQPTVYTIDTPAADGELVTANNARSVLVPPQAARRRILIIEGAPGFEHTFLKRALASDPGLDVDAVVRKGQNDDGRDTYFVQAGERRAAALSNGYPSTREALFQYDAVVFGNIAADAFTREQLELTARFVAERGGGLLVLGARSFDREGLSNTPLAEVLPVDLSDRRTRGAAGFDGEGAAVNAPAVTADGAAHPATRLAASIESSRALWSQLPALASVSLVGGPRPGAQVLAVTASPGGDAHPLIAVQRYGQGRTMVFAGEASWRWRMMRPSSDTAYDTIWRQLVRWLAATAPGQVSMPTMSVAVPGTTEPVVVMVRDERFGPVTDAEVTVNVTTPDGEVRTIVPALTDAGTGRYVAPATFDRPGVYTLAADARRPGTTLGVATRHVLAGGVDIEMSDPRQNVALLQRLAATTRGRYLPAGQAGELADLVRAAAPSTPVTETRDLWHNVWTLLAIMSCLGGEWLLRRRWGLA